MAIGLVLLYHRVTSIDSDPWALCVTPEHFDQHMQVLAKHTHPLALAELVESAKQNNLRPRSAAVTFDDGYADNLLEAAPLLERHGVPATFFLSTGWIEQQQQMWWDELEGILLGTDGLPEEINLEIAGEPRSWRVEKGKTAVHPSWRAWDEPPTLRHKAYAEIWSCLHQLGKAGRTRAMSRLRSQAGVKRAPRQSHRPLTVEEVVRLSRRPNVEVGAHTVNHTALSSLDRRQQRRELAESREWLESTTGAPVKSFAYPFGKPADFTDVTVSLLEELGFGYACVAEGAAVEQSADLYRVPRVHVPDMDGAAFERLLDRWLGDGVGPTPAQPPSRRSEERFQIGRVGLDRDKLKGAGIDAPRPYSPFSTPAVVAGWALGAASPARGAAILRDGRVVQEEPLGAYRRDVAEVFPDAKGAAWSGFRFALDDDEMDGLQIGVLLEDGSSVPLGMVHDRKVFAAREGNPRVCVVIPCYNQAHFLDQAIESVLAQSYSPVEIVVVDDGSIDNTAEVAIRYPGVRCVTQQNRGLPGARNTGLHSTDAPYAVFLDADDMLLPDAVLAGVMFLEDHPEHGFVWGYHRLVNTIGAVTGVRDSDPFEAGGYEQLLQRNFVSMGATVVHRRQAVIDAGGFDPKLKACEDYDLYLRVARNSPFACHGQVVADYRQHKGNLTKRSDVMLEASVSVLMRQKEKLRGEAERKAFKQGLSFWRRYYGRELVAEFDERLAASQWRRAAGDLVALARHHPTGLIGAARSLKRRFVKRSSATPEAAGAEESGLPRRLKPISDNWGFDRGKPIDRYYIESFLDRCSSDIRGRVLEIGDNSYTYQFGKEAVEQSDVLNAESDVPGTTFVGDLTDAENVPSGAFDCVILTQTLHLIYDTRAALHTLHRILAPGGVLLLTVPGITRISQNEWGGSWFWSFTTNSMKRLIEEVFDAGMVEVEAHGNVLTASAFLYGMATWELTRDELDFRHPNYEVVVTVRARK